MKKVLSVALMMLLITSLFVFSGCEKNVEDEREKEFEDRKIGEEIYSEDDVTIEEKTPTVIDRSESRIQDEEEIKEEIEGATQRYLDMLYGDKVANVEFNDVRIYKGDEAEMKYVDLDVDDYAFQIDYEIEPSSTDDIEVMTEYLGIYDGESGRIIVKNGYGVMRYNVESNKYDVTSITPDGF